VEASAGIWPFQHREQEGNPLPHLEERYRKNASFVAAEIADGLILVPIRDNVRDLADVYTCNETAARIWALVDGQRSAQEIWRQIAAEFEVGEEEARQDVAAFLGQLESAGAVQRA
jgi:hypothetical protein